MNIIETSIVETCINGDFVVRYVFDMPWTADAIQAMHHLGRLRYYASFPRPMFQLTCNDIAIVKGVQGMYECRIIYSRSVTDESRRKFMLLLLDAINNPPGEGV